MKRERYTLTLKCKCGNAGRVEYEENVYPVHGDVNREFVGLKGDFTAGIGRDPPVYCRACGQKVSG